MDRQKQEFRSSVYAKRSYASEAEAGKKKTKRFEGRVRRETVEGVRISERYRVLRDARSAVRSSRWIL